MTQASQTQTKPALNRTLIERVILAMEAREDSTHMGSYFRIDTDQKPVIGGRRVQRGVPITPNEILNIGIEDCGTAACILGWGILLAGDEGALSMELEFGTFYSSGSAHVSSIDNAEQIASDLFGITESQSAAMIYKDNWPTPYYDMSDREGAILMLYDILNVGATVILETE